MSKLILGKKAIPSQQAVGHYAFCFYVGPQILAIYIEILFSFFYVFL